MCYLATSVCMQVLSAAHCISNLPREISRELDVGMGTGSVHRRWDADAAESATLTDGRRSRIRDNGLGAGMWGLQRNWPTMDIFISTIWMGSNAFRRELSIDYACILVTVGVFKIFSLYVNQLVVQNF